MLFFSVAPFAPLLKYTCYMCTRQGAHKSHRISSSLCSHDNALLYLYWYLYFMLIWSWCILYYVWWEAIKLFWILNLESYCEYIYDFFPGTIPINFENVSVYLRRPPACITTSCMICMCSWVWSHRKNIYMYSFYISKALLLHRSREGHVDFQLMQTCCCIFRTNLP